MLPIRHLTIGAVLLLVAVCLLPWAYPEEQTAQPTVQPASPHISPEEKADAEIGKSAAKEIEKQFKIVENPPDLPRIEAVIAQLRPVTEKPHQSYQVKVIAGKAINAFSLPGGYLYYTQGLLEAVESEDELAAVSAHEMAHICLNHPRKLMSKDERYQRILAPILLASLLSDSKAVDPGAVATVAHLIAQDALNHYGREAELEADSQAVLYLKESKRYNPVAMLTVTEGLARIEGGEPQVEMGVFQTHPLAKARIEAIVRRLQELGVPIERRRVTKSLVAEAQRLTQGDREIGELRLNGRVVFQPAAEFEGLSPAARAQRSAEILNSLLLADLQLLEVGLVKEGDSALVQARGETILTITPADAAFHNTTVEALADQAMEAIRLGFQEEKVKRAY